MIRYGGDIINPVHPVDADGRPLPGWRFNTIMPADYPAYVWDHEYGVRALSAVEVVNEPEHPEQNGPHYHVSFTRWRFGAKGVEGPLRIDSADAAYLLRTCFGGLEGWEEDNHVENGQARNFWRPVDETRVGMECFCKRYEPRVIEDGGDYVWRPL